MPPLRSPRIRRFADGAGSLTGAQGKARQAHGVFF